MIQINRKEDCCGCEACAQICPKHCIQMQTDQEGFAYPEIDRSVCVACGLCEQICPILHPQEIRMPRQIQAVCSQNETIRLQSSSGGFFSELAHWVIAQGGVVVGAAFTHTWSVKHLVVDSLEGLDVFRGSKYVQSRIGDVFLSVKTYLKTGRWVLFSGTSCQIAGLKRFLSSAFCDRLLLVEVVCHGVPSNGLWQKYLKEQTCHSLKNLSKVQFRNKEKGWKTYHVCLEWGNDRLLQPFRENPYMQCFIKNLSLRPACYQCRFKSFATGSDIALADYWGVQKLQPAFDDDRGIGLVFLFSEKAERIFTELNIKKNPTAPLEQIVKYNPSIILPSAKPKRRMLFWIGLRLGVPFSLLAKGLAHQGFRGWLKRIGKK